jgi:hypothetical protein
LREESFGACAQIGLFLPVGSWWHLEWCRSTPQDLPPPRAAPRSTTGRPPPQRSATAKRSWRAGWRRFPARAFRPRTAEQPSHWIGRPRRGSRRKRAAPHKGSRPHRGRSMDLLIAQGEQK